MKAEPESFGYFQIALCVCAAMLIAATIQIWPYGFYTLLRIMVSATAIYGVWRWGSLDRTQSAIAGLFVVAFLFNPLIPVHLPRAVWLPIDIVAAILFLAIARRPSDTLTVKQPPDY